MALWESMLGTALNFLRQGAAFISHICKVPRMQAQPHPVTAYVTAIQLILIPMK